MKLTDEDKYRLGYAQGYYDAICQTTDMYEKHSEKYKKWARNSLDTIITDLLEKEKQ